MTFTDRIAQAKPYAWGLVAGLALAPIIGFSFDWVVTAGTMKEAVTQAKIEQLAAVCAGNATAHWVAENRELASLKGWENREERGKLVQQFVVDLPGIETIQRQVVRKCDDLLRV